MIQSYVNPSINAHQCLILLLWTSVIKLFWLLVFSYRYVIGKKTACIILSQIVKSLVSFMHYSWQTFNGSCLIFMHDSGKTYAQNHAKPLTIFLARTSQIGCRHIIVYTYNYLWGLIHFQVKKIMIILKIIISYYSTYIIVHIL